MSLLFAKTSSMAYIPMSMSYIISIFWISYLYLLLTCHVTNAASSNQIIYTEDDDCNKVVTLGAATVYSSRGFLDDRAFSLEVDCQITFKAERDSDKLMINFESVDIPGVLVTGACTHSLLIYDSNRAGIRPFRTAGSHNGLCGEDRPGLIVSTSRYVSIHFEVSDRGAVGRGFKFQITAFSEADSMGRCKENMFLCGESEKCINSTFRCDNVKHCPRASDEKESDCKHLSRDPSVTGTDSDGSNGSNSGFFDKLLSSFGVAGTVGIVVGGILVIAMFVICIVCTFKRCGKSTGEADHRPSLPSSTHGSVGLGQGQTSLQTTKDGITYHQVPQIAPQMNPHMMNNGLNYSQAPSGSKAPPTYGLASTLPNQQHLSQQRSGYIVGQPQPPIEMHMPVGYPVPNQPINPAISMPNYSDSYNSPFHLPRGESHSYSSGYSSQQGVIGGGFQPMHTKPIIPHKGYVQTSDSSRSSRSGSETIYTQRDVPCGMVPPDRGRIPAPI